MLCLVAFIHEWVVSEEPALVFAHILNLVRAKVTINFFLDTCKGARQN